MQLEDNLVTSHQPNSKNLMLNLTSEMCIEYWSFDGSTGCQMKMKHQSTGSLITFCRFHCTQYAPLFLYTTGLKFVWRDLFQMWLMFVFVFAYISVDDPTDSSSNINVVIASTERWMNKFVEQYQTHAIPKRTESVEYRWRHILTRMTGNDEKNEKQQSAEF